ncbi:MAG: hypothetical protein HC932_01485 [Thermales bacterium]|nr:hypothetical protein [Thermales bacterium]
MNENLSEQNLQNIIQNSEILSSGEKSILLKELEKYTPLEKLKLRKDILQNIVPIEIDSAKTNQE